MEDLQNRTGSACPELPTLLAWYSHQAEDPEGLSLRQHVLSCPHCQAHLNELTPVPVDGRPALTLIISQATTEEHREGPSSEQLRSRSHLKLISNRRRAAPIPDRTSSQPDAKHLHLPRPTGSPAGHGMGVRATLAAPPGPRASASAGASPARPGAGFDATVRPHARPVVPRGVAPHRLNVILGLLLLVSLVLLGYATWYATYRLPAFKEVIQAARQPYVVETADTLSLEPQTSRQAEMPSPALIYGSSQNHALLRVVVPDGGPQALYELILLDSQGTVIWNQMRVANSDGAIQLVLSPAAMGPGTYTLRAVTTSPDRLPRSHQARLRVLGPLS